MPALRVLLPLLLALGAAAAEPEAIRLQLNYAHQFQFAGYYTAEARGYFRDEGLAVELLELAPSQNPVEELFARRCDAAVYGPGIVRDWGEGRDLALIAVIQQRAPAVLLVRQDSPVSTLAELVRRPRDRLVGPYYDGHLELEVGLRQLGMTSRTAFTRTKDQGDFDRFVRGEIDVLPAYLTNESIRLAEMGVAVRSLPLGEGTTSFFGDALICRGDTWRSRPDLVLRLRRAVIRGWQRALAAPEEAIDAILADHPSRWQSISREHLRAEAAAVATTLAADLVQVGRVDIDRLQTMAQRLAEAGLPATYRADLCWGGIAERDRWLPALAWGLGIAVAVSGILILLVATIRRGARREDEVHRAMIDAADGLFLFHGVAESGAHLRLTRASASITEVCGFSLREAQADPTLLLTIAVDEDRPGLANALAQTISTGNALRHRFRMRHARLRSTRHVLLLASRLPGPHAHEYAGACLDITSEAEAEQALSEAQRRLESARRSESLGLLAGGVAHDFNNLLGAIRGNAELAMVRLETDDPAKERIQRVLEAADRAAGLVRQILAYAGRGTIELRPIDLAEELRVLRELLSHSIPAGTSLELTTEEAIPPVMFDPAQLQQVLVNLIVNAAESYDGAAGVVSIALRRSPSGFARIEISDRGSGMDAATQARMFEPYFTTKRNGHGLGLAAVQGIVRASGAALACRSARGEGTTFTIDIPPGATGCQAAIQRESPAPETGRNILIVDDDELMREMAGQMARELGFTVETASGGIDAARILDDPGRSFALAIIDCAMPDRDGPSVLRELRARGSRLPVLLVSGMIDAGMIGAGLLDRRTRFLAKPFSKALLDRTMRLLLRPGQEDESSSSTFASMQRESSLLQVVRPKTKDYRKP